MFVRWFLFETKVGRRLLASLERRAHLAVVDADWLGTLPCNAGLGSETPGR